MEVLQLGLQSFHSSNISCNPSKEAFSSPYQRFHNLSLNLYRNLQYLHDFIKSFYDIFIYYFIGEFVSTYCHIDWSIVILYYYVQESFTFGVDSAIFLTETINRPCLITCIFIGTFSPVVSLKFV